MLQLLDATKNALMNPAACTSLAENFSDVALVEKLQET